MNSSPHINYSLNLREAIQTPSCIIHNNLDLLNPNLPPPCSLMWSKIPSLIRRLRDHPNVLLELPNPISSPTIANRLKHMLGLAVTVGVDSRIALHIRLKPLDTNLASACKATRIYVYGSVQKRNRSNQQTIQDLVRKLNRFANHASGQGVKYIRASIEHATQTPLSDVRYFIKNILKINNRLGFDLISGLGLPDTNGIANPENYLSLLNTVLATDTEHRLTLFTHLHNDNNLSMTNYREITKFCTKHKIPMCIETVPDIFPGERVGIRPTQSQIPSQIFSFIPKMLLSGTSWISSSSFDQNHFTHVAGVHTGTMSTYAPPGVTNHPHPGLYTIMGKENLATVQRLISSHCSSDKVLSSAALVARELSAQYGHLPQSAVLAFTRLLLAKPGIITRIAKSFGPPSKWLEKPTPNLSPLLDQLPPGIVN